MKQIETQQQDSDSIIIGSIANRNFTDIDEQAKCLSGYDQRYQQLSSGSFRGEFSTIYIGDTVSLYFEKVNKILDQVGAMPDNEFSAIFLMNEDEPCKFNGHVFTKDSVFFGSPGAEFQCMSKPGTHFCVIGLKRIIVETHYSTHDAFFGIDARLNGSYEIYNSGAQSLRKIVTEIKTLFAGSLTKQFNSRQLLRFNQSIEESLSKIISENEHALKQPHVSRVAHHHVDKVRDFILSNADQDLSVAMLCDYAGVCRRTLEYDFQVTLGKSPATYLRLVRLNEIRRALQSMENLPRSIGDIAAEWGIWHPSRFSNYYRVLFGELPSQTKKKAIK